MEIFPEMTMTVTGLDHLAGITDAMGIERGHRTLVIIRKGGKVVTIPLAQRTTRAIDLAVGERCQGPVFLAAGGRRLDRHGAGRIVRRVARRAVPGDAIGQPGVVTTSTHMRPDADTALAEVGLGLHPRAAPN